MQPWVDATRAWLRVALTENLNLKVLSFVLALVSYSLVHGGQDARRSIVVDLEVALPSEQSDHALVGGIPQSVRLYVRGTNQTIDNLRAGALSVQVDLASSQPSHVTFDPKMVTLPEGMHVEIEQFDPPYLDLRWEDRIVREVPIEVSVVGVPNEGFVVKGSLFAEPKKVRVRGPQTEVITLQHIRADAFDVRGLTEGTYPRTVALERPSPRLRIDPTSALVTAEITREVSKRDFPRLSVVVVGPSRGRSLPAEVDVHLVCPPDVLSRLRPDQVVPHVQVTSKEHAGSESLPVEVELDKCEATVVPPRVVAHW